MSIAQKHCLTAWLIDNNNNKCAGGHHNMPRPYKLTFDVESGVRVTCDVGYICANFSLPRPLCSRLRPDVRNRQTDVRRASSLNASALWWQGHNNQDTKHTNNTHHSIERVPS